MQTQEAAAAAEHPLVRLKNGEYVSRHLVHEVLRLKREENGEILFNDLFMYCQDESSGNDMRFIYFDGTLRRLTALGLLNSDGSVYGTIRSIVLDLAS